MKRFLLAAILTLLLAPSSLAGEPKKPYTYRDEADEQDLMGSILFVKGGSEIIVLRKIRKKYGGPATLEIPNPLGAAPAKMSDAEIETWVKKVTKLSGKGGAKITGKGIAGEGLTLESPEVGEGLGHLLVSREIQIADLGAYLKAMRAEGSAIKSVELAVTRNPMSSRKLICLKISEITAMSNLVDATMEFLYSGYLRYKSAGNPEKVYNLPAGKYGLIERWFPYTKLILEKMPDSSAVPASSPAAN